MNMIKRAGMQKGKRLNPGKLTPAFTHYGLLFFLFCLMSPCSLRGQIPANLALAYDAYIHGVESRLNQQHRSSEGFLVSVAAGSDHQKRVRGGEMMVEKLTPATNENFSGGMLHHWRGTAFVPGAKAADFERIMKAYSSYQQYFSPQVLQMKVLSHAVDRFQVIMRVRQKHVITVVLDSTYDVNYGRLDAQHGYSSSVSTQVKEIDRPGTSEERALGDKDEHGFLWRQNTYWSYEERDGGLYLQLESVSLSRAIPLGLGWVIAPFVESVPRESMEFTLQSTMNALKK
jgi:hypothetical protein